MSYLFLGPSGVFLHGFSQQRTFTLGHFAAHSRD